MSLMSPTQNLKVWPPLIFVAVHNLPRAIGMVLASLPIPMDPMTAMESAKRHHQDWFHWVDELFPAGATDAQAKQLYVAMDRMHGKISGRDFAAGVLAGAIFARDKRQQIEAFCDGLVGE